MSGLFTSIRFVMALLTVLAIVGKPFIPPKTLVIHPASGVRVSIDGDAQITWLDQPRHFWRCDFPERGAKLYCGMVFDWNAAAAVDCISFENMDIARAPANAEENFDYPLCQSPSPAPAEDGWGRENGIKSRLGRASPMATCAQGAETPFEKGIGGSLNFADYDGVSLKINYEGRGQYLRIYVRDRNPEYQKVKPGIADKYIATLIRTEDLRTGPLLVKWKEFSVEQWWTIQHNPPSQIAGPEFGHVVMIGVDNAEPGVHRVRVDEIKLVGDRISDKAYLLAILAFWTGFLFLEGFLRYYKLSSSIRHQREELKELVGGARLLEEEKTQLQSRALTDPLTGVCNRNGLANRLQERHKGNLLPSAVGLIVMDIDHFKSINDTYGHEAGDGILRDFAKLISNEIREGDVFARWGGEEFLLLVENIGQQKLLALAEKLRQRIEGYLFSAAPGRVVTISLGVAITTGPDVFEAVFKRADQALYKAKQHRNIAVCEWLE